jgi:hypothetical protein
MFALVAGALSLALVLAAVAVVARRARQRTAERNEVWAAERAEMFGWLQDSYLVKALEALDEAYATAKRLEAGEAPLALESGEVVSLPLGNGFDVDVDLEVDPTQVASMALVPWAAAGS